MSQSQISKAWCTITVSINDNVGVYNGSHVYEQHSKSEFTIQTTMPHSRNLATVPCPSCLKVTRDTLLHMRQVCYTSMSEMDIKLVHAEARTKAFDFTKRQVTTLDIIRRQMTNSNIPLTFTDNIIHFLQQSDINISPHVVHHPDDSIPPTPATEPIIEPSPTTSPHTTTIETQTTPQPTTTTETQTTPQQTHDIDVTACSVCDFGQLKVC